MIVPSHERVNEILGMRSTDSRKGDMEQLTAYIQDLRAQLLGIKPKENVWSLKK